MVPAPVASAAGSHRPPVGWDESAGEEGYKGGDGYDSSQGRWQARPVGQATDGGGSYHHPGVAG